MGIAIAMLHIGGAIVASVAFGFAVLLILSWLDGKQEAKRKGDMAVAIGIPLAELEEGKHAESVVRYMSARASGELLCNRLSDLCGWIRTAWGWVALLLQVCFIGGAIWFSVSEGRDAAVLAWGALAVTVLFTLVSMAFAFACYVLTGRYPGEAAKIRKGLREYHGSRAGPSE